MPSPLAALLNAPSDSARIVEGVYTVSILATLPLVLALLVAIPLRNSTAGARVLIWRSTVIALVGVFVTRLLLSERISFTVPDMLAAPLVLLGRIQVAANGHVSSMTSDSAPELSSIAATDLLLLNMVALVYGTGVLVVLLRTTTAWLSTAKVAARATDGAGSQWESLLRTATKRSGIRRAVAIRITEGGAAPATWGFFRPVILIPVWAARLPQAQKQALLLHELSHIRAGDWAFGMLARLMCALYWFHPAAWWVARALRSESEFAADNRVIGSGVKLSDYAELLMLNADYLRRAPRVASVAVPLGNRVGSAGRTSPLFRAPGLRARLSALFETGHDCSAPRAAISFCAAALAVSVALPAGLTSLNPSRGMLTDLMTDIRWESRAYAVRGLAQRPDSIAMAQLAADADPSPRVRAAAASALRGRPQATPAPENERGAQ